MEICFVPQSTGYFLGVVEESGYTAHACGITITDQVLLYATMNSKTITEGRAPMSETLFKLDIQQAKINGKHLLLVLKHQD